MLLELDLCTWCEVSVMTMHRFVTLILDSSKVLSTALVNKPSTSALVSYWGTSFKNAR